jgi:prepilin-type N-terminal cleavage/methylation domain-containing protein
VAPTLHRNRRPPRPGFSLIEILVVIAIIALLFSLGGAAYQRIRIAQTVKTTEDIVNKLQGGVDDQLQVLADEVRREKLTRSNDFSGLQGYCGGDLDRTEALLLYCRIKQYFPETITDLKQTCTAGVLAGKPGFTINGVNFPLSPSFAKLTVISANPAPPTDQVAAACLYVALTERNIGGKVFDSDAGTSGRHLDIVLPGPTVNNPVPARVYRDAWDRPVMVRRFHTDTVFDAVPYVKQAAVNSNGPRDPFDPLGKLFNASGWNKLDAETRLGTTFTNANRAVLVYSYGRNGVLDNFAGDDVVGYKLRSAGARGTNQP